MAAPMVRPLHHPRPLAFLHSYRVPWSLHFLPPWLPWRNSCHDQVQHWELIERSMTKRKRAQHRPWPPLRRWPQRFRIRLKLNPLGSPCMLACMHVDEKIRKQWNYATSAICSLFRLLEHLSRLLRLRLRKELHGEQMQWQNCKVKRTAKLNWSNEKNSLFKNCIEGAP